MQGTGGALLFSFGLFISSRLHAHAAGFGDHRYSYSVYGDIYSARGRRCWYAHGRRRECGNDDFWINDCVASYPPSVCDRRALFRRVGAGIALGSWNMSLAVYIMRFRPIRYGWGPGARRYIAINRGNVDSPRSCCRLRL